MVGMTILEHHIPLGVVDVASISGWDGWMSHIKTLVDMPVR
jgi:hypothetical protein